MPKEFGPITQQTRAAIKASQLDISAPLTAGIVDNMAEAYLSEQKMGTTDRPHESQTPSALERLHPRNLETTQAVLADIYRTSILNTGSMTFELDGTVKWTDKNPDLGHKCVDGNQHTVTFKRTTDEPGKLEATSASCSYPKGKNALGNPDQNAPVMPISLTIREITRKIERDEERRRIEEKLRNETSEHRLRRIRQEAYPEQEETEPDLTDEEFQTHFHWSWTEEEIGMLKKRRLEQFPGIQTPLKQFIKSMEGITGSYQAPFIYRAIHGDPKRDRE